MSIKQQNKPDYQERINWGWLSAIVWLSIPLIGLFCWWWLINLIVELL